MFKSIRWRFILIYFLLVFLAMSIVGIFIVNQLEGIQLNMNIKNMEARIRSIIASYESLNSGMWDEDVEEIKKSINSVQVGYNENIYVILNDENRTIIAGSVEESIGVSAFNNNKLNNYILTKSMDGSSYHIAPTEQFEDSENPRFYHMSFPVQIDGNIKGYIYLINNIDYIYDTVNESRQIMTQATIIALTITIFLGLILSTSITGPIKELTVKAKQMSLGDFDQKVSVKSDDEIGQLGNMFNYLIDQLKKSMSSLQQEKSKMETTFTYMADGVLTVDLSGSIVHANPIAKNILSIEKNIDEKFDDAIVRLKDSISMEYIKSKGYHGTDLVEKNGETYNLDYAPFMNSKNEIGGVILVFKNITEQHRIDKLQKEFVANVSHELKTPITTIKSYAETLLDGALEEKSIAEEFLNVINSESDRMSRLVSDLLRLSRMDYEQTKWNRETINLCDMVVLVVKKLQIQIKNKNIKVHLDVPREFNIKFDRDGFEQILLNIAGNAVKYTPDNGNVWIDAKNNNNSIVIKVKDDGRGIPKQDQIRIFERFYRVDKARARGLGGTGLGLSIAKQIAEAHNCTIAVNSEIDEGTEMIITIPQ